MVAIPHKFDGEKFANKFGIDKLYGFWVQNGELFCPSLPDLTDADIADCVITPTYSITPSMSLVAVGDPVTLTVTGAPDAIVTLDVGGETVDIALDESGYGNDTFTAESAGSYYVMFNDVTLSKQIVKIEVI